MSTFIWLQLSVVCLLGAISPGPSLALVTTNTITKGRMYGVVTSLGHGVGITLWAFFTAIGVAKLIVETEFLLISVQFLGSFFLLYLGMRTIYAKDNFNLETLNGSFNRSWTIFSAASEGFIISLVNPKIALFFIAIFSHFVQSNADWLTIGMMGIMAGFIDAVWYLAIAITITKSGIIPFLKLREKTVNMAVGGIFIFISIYLLISLVGALLIGFYQ
ncbi:MAG: LysE family translocator [Chloroflexota bacterium]